MTPSPQIDSATLSARTKPRFKVLAIGLSIAALALSSCGDKTATNSVKPSANNGAAIEVDISQFEREADFAIGSETANVALVEYASVSCGHCANWHSTVYPDFKKKYIDTGKVRYIFRTFPTAPIQLADAGHKIAMCAGKDNYFKNIKIQFDRQKQIFDMAGQGRAREAYISLAKASGLSEQDFLSCIQDEEIDKAYEATVQSGYDLGITGTPSFFINGEAHKVYDLESIEAVILPMLGEAMPDKAEDTESEKAEMQAGDDENSDTENANTDNGENNDAPQNGSGK